MSEFLTLRLEDGEQVAVRFLGPHPQGFLVHRLTEPGGQPVGDPILVRTATRYAADGHADYPHEPGTLYDCALCEALMQEDDMTLNHGRARRIAAEWHSPNGDGLSALSHTGEITEEVLGAVAGALHYLRSARGRREVEDPHAVGDLRWLQIYLQKRGVGKYTGSRPWSKMWDDSHAEETSDA